MMFMNQWDVEDALERFTRTHEEAPNLLHGALTLAQLVNWTNSHSDGWAYWPKPCRAAKRLMELLQEKERDYRDDGCVCRPGTTEVVRFTDATDAELSVALRPIKAFLTRQGVDHSEVVS